MQFRLNNLDKKDVTLLKALAISSIVLHNFFHMSIPVHENEFTFDPARFHEFLHFVVHPAYTVQALFSFYGHLGVQLFIFLSAYGLAKSHWNSSEGWLAFMCSRVKKLYPMFGLAFLFWVSLVEISGTPAQLFKHYAAEMLLVLAGISNFIPGIGLPPVGPWWFIPFILQFYAMWHFLRWLTNKIGWPGLVVFSIACVFVTQACNPTLEHWGINLGTTPIGKMRVICLGIIAARYPSRIKLWVAAIPSFAVLVLGSEYSGAWPLVSIAAVVIALWFYMNARESLRNSRILEKIGEYSLAIFLLNGIVRIPFVFFAHTLITQFLLCGCSAVVTFALAAFFHHVTASAPAVPSTAPAVAALQVWESPKIARSTGD